MSEASCVGCKFLFGDGQGYSDYTWENTEVTCALDRNPSLPEGAPIDWNMSIDNWPLTMNGRCDQYSKGPYIVVSPDGYADDAPIDAEQTSAIGSIRKFYL